MTKAPHPPFKLVASAQHGEPVCDFTSKAGANRLAALIREAWAAIGHDVQPEVQPLRSTLSEWDGQYVVRLPQLVNGLVARR